MKLTNEQKEKLTKIASMTKKAAAPDNTGFDEKPAAEKRGPQPEEQVAEPPQQVPNEEPAAEPMMEEQAAQGPTMQEIVSVSARGFLGPEIFDAAMQGDPNAQNMIALTAANVAVKMGEIYMRQGAMRMAEAEQQQPAEEQDGSIQEPVPEQNTQAAAKAEAVQNNQASPRQQMAV